MREVVVKRKNEKMKRKSCKCDKEQSHLGIKRQSFQKKHVVHFNPPMWYSALKCSLNEGTLAKQHEGNSNQRLMEAQTQLVAHTFTQSVASNVPYTGVPVVLR